MPTTDTETDKFILLDVGYINIDPNYVYYSCSEHTGQHLTNLYFGLHFSKEY